MALNLYTKRRIREQYKEFCAPAVHTRKVLLNFDKFPNVPRDRDERLFYFSPQNYTSARLFEWCKLYKGDDFPAPFGKHHRMIADILKLRGQTVEFLAPREYGKSTLMYAFSDWCRCYGVPYVLHVEHDGDISSRVSVGAGQCLDNAAMVSDYGLSAGAIWRPNGRELIVRNTNPFADTSESYLRCIGVLQVARGSTSTKAERITIAIVNDVVANYPEAVSYAWNNFLEHFIREDLAYAGGGKRDEDISIFFVTTIQAKNDISCRLRMNPVVMTYECPAVEGDKQDVLNFVEFVSNDIPNIREAIDICQGTIDGGLTGQGFGRDEFAEYCQARPDYLAWFEKLQSTWPEQFPMSRNAWDIYRTSSSSWLQEKQHITGDSKFQRFREEWFQKYDLTVPEGRIKYAMCIDWSGMPKEGNDPKSIYCGAYHQDNSNIYTLGVWCDIADHEETFRKVYDVFWQCFPWYAGEGVHVYMEDIISATGLGLSYFEKMRLLEIANGGDEAYWVKLPIILFDAKKRGDKLVAISALRPIAEQRRIFYCQGHTHQSIMKDQFLNFEGKHTHKPCSLAQKIDILDTIAMFAYCCRVRTVVERQEEGKTAFTFLQSPPKKPGVR
jgi:hypothetical protein